MVLERPPLADGTSVVVLCLELIALAAASPTCPTLRLQAPRGGHVELVGRQRFYTEYGTNLDEMTKEFVRKWDEFEMAIYREQNPEEEHP